MPGYSGHSWIETNSTSASACEDRVGPVAVVHVPVEDQHALEPVRGRRARRAATAALPKKQNPIARAGSAWWPGGRSAETPACAVPPSSASTSATAPPAARSAASNVARDGGGVGVDGPAAARAQLLDRAATYGSGWTAPAASRSTAGRLDQRRAEPAVARSSRPPARGSAPGARDGPGMSCGERGVVAQPERGHAGTVRPPVNPSDPTSSSSARARPGCSPACRPPREGARVTLVSARPLAETASYWAQGGLAAALAVDDSPELHLQDTLAAGRGLVRRSAAEVLTRRGGRPLPRARGARRALRRRPPRRPRARPRGRPQPPPRHPRRRQRDRPADPAPALRRRRRAPADRGARGRPRRRACRRDGRCAGVRARGRAHARRARGTILATGGAAALWSRTTNPPGSFGSGLLLARDAGAALADLEFTQFHPTAVVGVTGREGFLISEAIRGEGATLHDAHGERFVDELAPRDDVARAIFRTLREQDDPGGQPRHAHVDPERFPNVVAALREAGLDPATRARPGRARQPLRDGRRSSPTSTAARRSPGCTRSASAPAPACTAPTGWPRTRCRSASCSAAAPRCGRSTSRAPAPTPPAAAPATGRAAARRARPARRCGATPAWSATPRACAAARRPAPARPAGRPQRAAPRGDPRRPRPRRLPGDRPRPRRPPHGRSPPASDEPRPRALGLKRFVVRPANRTRFAS